jgi:hypothetical protein
MTAPTTDERAPLPEPVGTVAGTGAVSDLGNGAPTPVEPTFRGGEGTISP